MEQTESFDNTPQPAASLSDWMSDLPDNLLVSRISIPGTHNTMSIFSGSQMRCQSWPLEAQLEAGIRFLDIRCKLEDDDFRLYHFNMYLEADFSTVLKVTLSFLKQHPRETVVIRVKEELAYFPNQFFGSRVRSYEIEEAPGQIWMNEPAPKLGEARGKIVILEELPNEIVGVSYEEPSVGNSWHLLSSDLKWDRVLKNLNMAEMASNALLHLTFCSGNGFFTNPEEQAKDINQRCYEYLRAQAGKVRAWGVVIMDFPGAGLIKTIVESNLATGK